MWPGVLKESLSEDVLALAAFHIAPARLLRKLAVPGIGPAVPAHGSDQRNGGLGKSLDHREEDPLSACPQIHTRCEPFEAAFLFLTVSPAQ